MSRKGLLDLLKGNISAHAFVKPMSEDQVETIIRKYALQNAVFFKGQANPKAVAGKVLGERPDMRPRSAEVLELVGEIVRQVNSLGLEKQTAALAEMDPNLMVKQKKERRFDLPELEEAGKVVMRIAPGPSGPLHIGHSRVAILNDEYVKRYDGVLINRLEDTNPEKIDPDAYDMIPEDLDWLGVKVHSTICQSDRFHVYYDITRKLIEMGKAFVCTCPGDSLKDLKADMRACPCRELPIEENLERYDLLLSNHYKEGEAVAVIKTDIAHPNPALRDFVALRIVDYPHPRTGGKFNVYPMMNLSVAVDDHLMGMTHVIRGKDHLNNTHRQEYIYDYLGWPKPRFYHYGLVNIPDTVLKTSLIRQSIKEGEYSGWDDVRTGTLRALQRRGITPDSIRRYWIEGGIKSVDMQFSWENLFSMNRDVIDDVSNRYFYVPSPNPIRFHGIDHIESHAPLHPDHSDRGVRHIVIKDGDEILLSPEDMQLLHESGMVRLKDLCNIELHEGARYAGTDLSVLKKGVKVVQWVDQSSVPLEILMPDGSISSGRVEKALLTEKGATVQLERFGFVRLHRQDGRVAAVFSHR